MSGLVVGGVVIPIASSGQSRDRPDWIDRARAFDGTYRASQVGGAVREWKFQTPPVTRTLADTYETTLASVVPLICSGDILSIPTMCCPEITGWSPVATANGNHYVVIDFTLHEVQPAYALLRYSPGDTITGESFTRSTAAYQQDAAGVYVSKGINTKRDGHYIAGVRTILLEGSRSNTCARSNDLGNATWSTGGTGSATLNAVGLDGTANSASTVTDSDAGAFYFRSQANAVANDSNPHIVQYWIKKDSTTSRFVGLQVQLTGGTLVSRNLNLNTQTGAIGTYAATSGFGAHRVIDAVLWWVVEVRVDNNNTGNTALTWLLYPAVGTVFGTASAAAQGSCVVGNVQVEQAAYFGTSPIITVAATVTRGADVYEFPFTTPPQEMTVYASYVELGSILVSGTRIFTFSTAVESNPLFLAYAGGVYAVYHHNGSASVQSTALSAPSVADNFEMVGRLFGDGSAQQSQSINGAATVDAAQTGAQAFGLATAWSGQIVSLNSAGTNAIGFGAYKSFKIVAGMRSMEQMRAL